MALLCPPAWLPHPYLCHGWHQSLFSGLVYDWHILLSISLWNSMVKCYFRANVLEVFKTITPVKILVYFYWCFVFGKKRYFAVQTFRSPLLETPFFFWRQFWILSFCEGLVYMVVIECLSWRPCFGRVNVRLQLGRVNLFGLNHMAVHTR